MASLYSICIPNRRLAKKVASKLRHTFKDYFEVYWFEDKVPRRDHTIPTRIRATKEYVQRALHNDSFDISTIIVGGMMPDEVRDLTRDAHDLITYVYLVTLGEDDELEQEMLKAKRRATRVIDYAELGKEDTITKLIALIQLQERGITPAEITYILF